MELVILYRISDAGHQGKIKLPHATKEHSLDNAIKTFGKDNFHIFADNCSPETWDMVCSKNIPCEQISLGNSHSFRYVYEYAIKHYNDQTAVYLLEDDYLHLPDSKQILIEGLQIADYVSLYDHPDKYISYPIGPNFLVKNGGELARVLISSSTHWKNANSTTMTFAAKVSTLKSDKKVWWKFTAKKVPNDFRAFLHLQCLDAWWKKMIQKKRVLITPLPSKSTHCETEFLAPLVDWAKI
jgi:hypothetical protein